MNADEKLRRIETRSLRQQTRLEKRLADAEQKLAENERTRAALVAAFTARLEQVERNSGRLDVLEAAVSAHHADLKRHTGK